MDNSNKVIIFLLVIILAIVVVLGIKIVGDSRQTISGAVVEELNPSVAKYEVYEEIPKVVEEEFPMEKQFETFKVIRGDYTTGSAFFLYEIKLDDIRDPLIEEGPIIIFDKTKTYLGYEELNEFLESSGINNLMVLSGENLEVLRDIRRKTGVRILGKAMVEGKEEIVEYFETFKVIRADPPSSNAILVFGKNFEDLKCSVEEKNPVILFDETKAYLGYEEIDHFIKSSGISQIVVIGSYDSELVTHIRRDLGVSVMVKFGKRPKDAEGIADVEPIVC